MTSSNTPAPLVVVAGATGSVGGRIIDRLLERGLRVRAVTRDAARVAPRGAMEVLVLRDSEVIDALAWEPVLRGSDAVVSALGASVALTARGRAGYLAVDVPVHAAIARAAQQAALRTGAYVSAYPGPGYDHTRYVRAHLEAERLLRAALPTLAVIRPTGIFSAFEQLVDLAARGNASVIGDGTARTNPIHPDDVADATVDALVRGLLDRAAPAPRAIGGPEILSRDDIVRAAFVAAGRPPPKRLRRIPPAAMRAVGTLLRPFHPRLGDLVEFVTAVSTHDGIAPAAGTRTLDAYLRAVAARRGLLAAGH